MQIAQCYIRSVRSINLIKKGDKIWDTLKNTGAEEKWAQKKEEQEKKIKRNNYFSFNAFFK